MKYVPIGLVGLVAALFVILAVAESRSQPSTNAPAIVSAATVPHYQTTALRQVVFTDDAQVSKGVGHVLVQMLSGTIPADVTRLTVLTDEDCTPDKDGVSHCTNRVEFVSKGGRGTAAIKHHHKMSEEPCLAPGEVVMITA